MEAEAKIHQSVAQQLRWRRRKGRGALEGGDGLEIEPVNPGTRFHEHPAKGPPGIQLDVQERVPVLLTERPPLGVHGADGPCR